MVDRISPPSISTWIAMATTAATETSACLQIIANFACGPSLMRRAKLTAELITAANWSWTSWPRAVGLGRSIACAAIPQDIALLYSFAWLLHSKLLKSQLPRSFGNLPQTRTASKHDSLNDLWSASLKARISSLGLERKVRVNWRWSRGNESFCKWNSSQIPGVGCLSKPIRGACRTEAGRPCGNGSGQDWHFKLWYDIPADEG